VALFVVFTTEEAGCANEIDVFKGAYYEIFHGITGGKALARSFDRRGFVLFR
jgi:hypothetical protein